MLSIMINPNINNSHILEWNLVFCSFIRCKRDHRSTFCIITFYHPLLNTIKITINCLNIRHFQLLLCSY